MNLWKSLTGMVEVELTSAEPGAAFHAGNEQNIPMFDVRQYGDLTARFRIYRRDYRRLASLCQRRGENLRIIRRRGIYWTGKRLLQRPVLLLGLMFLLFLVLFLPTRVFFIRVEGNSTVPTRKILAAAEESGICFGASRREVRSEKMKNALLSAVPELQWAGVNTSGCVATISVRERTDPEQCQNEEAAVSSIVAARDGVIYSCTVTRGNALCRVGQAVKEGQVLISGYTDCGISIRATKAEGEIYAETIRDLVVVTPSEWEERTDISQTARKYSLIIGKKRINLWKGSGIWDTSCGRMYTEYALTLPGGFRLPIALAVEEYTFYETTVSEILQPAAEEALSAFAGSYLAGQMVAGNILRRLETVFLEDGIYRMEGKYDCFEMIGRVQREQIGEYNGKSG